ncbi:MAG: hypothetical protein IPP07_23160 [Holophagales bacterium]|nr:hypothetical protein [Holophagales bacterium]
MRVPLLAGEDPRPELLEPFARRESALLQDLAGPSARGALLEPGPELQREVEEERHLFLGDEAPLPRDGREAAGLGTELHRSPAERLLGEALLAAPCEAVGEPGARLFAERLEMLGPEADHGRPPRENPTTSRAPASP